MDLIEEKPDKPIKGLITDMHPLDQPEGTWRSALNMNVSDAEFDGNLVSEASNQFCYQVGTGQTVVGHVEMNNNSVLVCSTDGTTSYLGVAMDCTYQQILATDCLGFDPCYPIRGVFKIINGCERVITLYDGKNTDKYLNIDRLQDYYTGEEFDCTKADLAFFTRQPILSYETTLIGGALPLGSYTFFVECLDRDLNRIGVSNELAQIIIVDNSDGGANIEQVPATDGGVPLTNKRLRFSVTNVPENVIYLRLYANIYRTGDGLTYETFYTNDLRQITDTVTYLEFSTLNASSVTRADAKPLVVPNSFYTKSKTHEIVTGRLVRANLEEKTYDWSIFQREISKALVNWTVEEVPQNSDDIAQYAPPYVLYFPFQFPSNNNPAAVFARGQSYPYNLPRNNTASFYINHTTFMSDEVYSIWIRPVMKGGITGPQFHVPGRPMDAAGVFKQSDISINTLSNLMMVSSGNAYSYTRPLCPTGEGWDSYTLVVETGVGIGTSDQIDIEEVKQFGVTTVTTDIGYGLNTDPAKGTVGNTLIPRWLLFNTGINYNFTNGDYLNVMAYYQCEEKYPEVESCDGQDYWGEDYWGNALTGEYIRHHRVPDLGCVDYLWKLDFNTQLGEKKKISLCVFNVQFPAQYANDVEYYEIGITKRTPENSTVIDKGILYHAIRYNPSPVYSNGAAEADSGKYPYYSDAFPMFPASINFTYPSNPISGALYSSAIPVTASNDYFVTEGLNIVQVGRPQIEEFNITIFHSPRQKFYPSSHSGYYYRREGTKYYSYVGFNDNGHPDGMWTLFLGQEKWTQPDLFEEWYNRNIEESKYVSPRSYDAQGFLIGTDIYPLNMSNVYHSATFSKLNADIDYFTNASCVILDTTGLNGNPQVYQDQKCHYVAVKKFNPNVNSDLFNTDTILLKKVTGDKSYSFFNGDCFINFFGFKKLAPKGQSSLAYGVGAQMRGVMFSGFESDINSELRHGTIFPNSFYFPHHYVGLQGMVNFVLQSDNNIPYLQGFFLDTFEILSRYDNAAEEEFRLNQDYAFVNRVDTGTNYNRFINYCSDCYGLYPTRIIWSPKSQDESVSENWRVNAANDYLDLDATTGDITGLWFDKNRMLVHTQDTTWFMAPNPQQMQLDQTNLYIGTGDFLSIPPEAVQRRNFGYAGADEPQSICDTPFGHCWIDAKDGRVFQFFEGVQEISAQGTKNWFRDNLPMKLLQQLQLFGINDYCCVNNNSVKGVGVRCVYDPRFRRLIVMKRDFEILNLFAFLGYKPAEPPAEVIEDNLYYDVDKCVFAHWNGESYEDIGFDNKDYFISRCWTMSYSFLNKSWVSWHSYMPSYSYSDNMYFYTFNDRHNDYAWKHGTDTFLSFYGSMWPSFVETVTKSFQTFNVDSLKWVGHTKYWDGITRQWVEDNNYGTIDGAMVYNEEQNSGKVDISLQNQISNPWGNIGYSATTKNVMRVADEYRTSGFYNLATGIPVVSRGWADIQSYFDADGFGNGWVDLVPTNIDTTASAFNMDFVRGKWAATRLWYEPETPSYGTAININSVTTIKTPR
jgi:hypothetical protein